MRFIDEFRGIIKTLRLAGRKHKQRFRILALQGSKRDERVWLFRRNNAAGDDDRRSAAALELGCEPIRQRRGCGKLQVVFQISADAHAIRWRAQGSQAIRIFLALHEEGAGIGKHAL